MTIENLIHVRLEHKEAVTSRKDILFSEMGILKIQKTMNNYRVLRLQESKLKQIFVRKIKECHKDLTELKSLLPKIKISKRDAKNKPHKETKQKEENLEEIESYDVQLERQLRNIQEKLNYLNK